MNKTYGLIGFGMLTFILFFSLASAAVTVGASDKTLAQDGTTIYSFTLTNTNETVDDSAVVSIKNIVQGSEQILFYINDVDNNETINVPANKSVTVDVTYNVQSGFKFEFAQVYSTKLVINNQEKATFTLEDSSFCENIENKAKINVEISDVTVIEGFGESDEDGFWYLRDVIEIDVKVDDTGSWDVDDIKLEWELYNTAGEKIDDGEENKFDLKSGKKNTLTFVFKLDENIEDFEGEYAILYVKATGEISDKDSSYDKDDSCGWDKTNKIEVITKDDFVIVDNVKLNDNLVEIAGYNNLNCEEKITVSFEIWNIGNDDQEDLYVEVYSEKLGIYEKFDINGIDAFESQFLEFEFIVPSDLKDGKYNLEFEVFDDSNDIYENSEEDESNLLIQFKNENSCLVVKPYITANLDTEAKEGKDMIIKVNVRNDDVQSRTFSIGAQGYESWAKLKEIPTESFVVESGRIQELSLTLEIKDEIEGDKAFNLNVYSDGKLISTQPVAVTVEAKEGIQDLLDGINWKVVGIVLVNLALLVAIIIVVRKILKRN